MRSPTLLNLLLGVATVCTLTACAETSMTGPGTDGTPGAPLPGELPPVFEPRPYYSASHNRQVDLGGCAQLQVPAGSSVLLRVHATGFQNYRWTGSEWSFVGPVARLFADAGANGAIGTHYAGPTWEHIGGGKAIGAVLQRCTVTADAIPWLLLQVVSAEGSGPFASATHIQRVNTVGGNAPAYPGHSVGHEVMVPYTTDYFFYR